MSQTNISKYAEWRGLMALLNYLPPEGVDALARDIVVHSQTKENCVSLYNIIKGSLLDPSKSTEL